MISEWLQNRWIVGALAIVSVCILVGGVYYWSVSRPLPLPMSAEEGLKHLDTTRYYNMPEYRQREYRMATYELLRTMDTQERQELFETQPALRETMRTIRRETMMDEAYRFAMASEQERLVMLQTNPMQGMMRGQGQRQGGGERGAQRPDPSQMTEAQRQEFQERMQSRRGQIRSRISERFQTGNPQENALMGEYFRARREARQRQNQ